VTQLHRIVSKSIFGPEPFQGKLDVSLAPKPGTLWNVSRLIQVHRCSTVNITMSPCHTVLRRLTSLLASPRTIGQSKNALVIAPLWTITLAIALGEP